MAYIEELDENIIEPITLEETKDYLGYAQDDHKDDAFLTRLITASRVIVEGGIGRIIVSRNLRYHTERIDGPYNLPPSIEEVTGVTYEIYDHDTEGYRLVDTMHYEYDPGEDATVYAHFPHGARHICIDFKAGFIDVPEDIRMAILDVCKMKYERSASDPFAVIRPQVQRYKVMRI